MIRADPETRLAGRARVRRERLIRKVGVVWRLSWQSARRLPALHASALLTWWVIHWWAVRTIAQAHLGLGETSAGAWQGGLPASLAAAFAALAIAPPVIAGCLGCAIHRHILDGDRSAWPYGVARSVALLTALWVAMWGSCAAYALILVLAWPVLGLVSTVLTALLLAPLPIGAVLASVRILTGWPGASLGLPRAAAEAWMISGGRLGSILVVAALGLGPLLVIRVATAFSGYGWWAAPVMDIATISWTGCQTAEFYRRFRVSAAMRPDRRPSRNRSMRQEPVLR